MKIFFETWARLEGFVTVDNYREVDLCIANAVGRLSRDHAIFTSARKDKMIRCYDQDTGVPISLLEAGESEIDYVTIAQARALRSTAVDNNSMLGNRWEQAIADNAIVRIGQGKFAWLSQIQKELRLGR